MLPQINGLVSVIIPCRNGENYLAEAIESVKKQNITTEIIVVDDCSTDGTAKLAKELGCTVISISCSGTAKARNEGLNHVQGEYILFLDHDDILFEHAIKKLLQALVVPTDGKISMGKAQDFLASELDSEEKKRLAPKKDAYYGFLSGAVLLQRDIFLVVAGFNSELITGETVDFLIQVENAGFVVSRVDFVTVARRIHRRNTGRTMQKQEHKDYATILRNKLKNIKLR